jgi:hypothetical protein
MARTIRLLYRGQTGRLRKNFNWGISPPITIKSVIVMSAAEASVDPGSIFGIENATTFKLGDADVYVTNVSPHTGGVEFILHVNWGSPLDVLVDLTVLDPYEQFFPVN